MFSDSFTSAFKSALSLNYAAKRQHRLRILIVSSRSVSLCQRLLFLGPAFIMSSALPSSVDMSSAHISMQSLLPPLLTKIDIHVAEASICRRRQSFLSYSATVLLLVHVRPCAEGIHRDYTTQIINAIRTGRIVWTRCPRGTYHSCYDLLMQHMRELQSSCLSVCCTLEIRSSSVMTRSDETSLLSS